MNTNEINPASPAVSNIAFPGIAPEALPGIDLELAKKMYGGNSRIYMRLLFRFQEHFADRAEALLTALANNNFEDMTLIAHSIKGTSGQLAATQLSETAKKAEYACRAQDTEYATHINNTVKHLDELLSSIARLPEQE